MMKTLHILVRLCAVAAVFGGAGIAFPAQAQDRVILGPGVSSAPKYQGSDERRTKAIPLVDIARGPFFINLRNGAGVTPFGYGNVKFGAGIAYLPGFDRPHALGKVSDGAGARVFADWDTGGLNAVFGVTRAVSGGLDGVIADASLSSRHSVSPRLMLIPTIGTTWTDGDYNKSYFGVTPAEAPAAGVSSFSPGSGFKDVSIGLMANYALTEQVSLAASATVSRLLGEVRDSPIVFDDTQASGFVGLSWWFGG